MSKTQSRVFELLNNVHFVQWVNSPTDESTHYWTKWIANHPGCSRDVQIARRMILSSRLSSDEPLSDQSYDRMLENILAHGLNSRKTQSRHGFFTFRIVGVAASIALVLGLALYFYLTNDITLQKAAPITIIHKNAPPGSRVTTMLPDGSKVTLNAGSEISYPSEFIDSRQVELDGEAFFEVERDSLKPFYVSVNGNQVQVLGTSFNVRCYPEDDWVRVSVATGRVSYTSSSGENVSLSKDEESIHSLVNGSLVTGVVNRNDAFGWKDKILHFDSQSFNDIVIELERWYGVEIEISEGFTNRGPYSGEFYNATLEEVLEGLSFVYRFDHTIRDQQVNLNPKREDMK